MAAVLDAVGAVSVPEWTRGGVVGEFVSRVLEAREAASTEREFFESLIVLMVAAGQLDRAVLAVKGGDGARCMASGTDGRVWGAK